MRQITRAAIVSALLLLSALTWSSSNAEAGTRLAGLNLWGYCQADGYAGTILTGPVIGPNAAYDSWYCGWPDPASPVDFRVACQWQYPSAMITAAAPDDPNNAYTWNCYGDTLPNLQQCDAPWGTDLYAWYTTSADNICKWGCAMTAAVNVLNYYGVSTDPGALNNWLKTHQGYSAENGVIWTKVRQYAEEQGVLLTTPRYKGHDTATLQNQLNLGHPVIVGVPFWGRSPGHWVMATGYAGGGTWYIKDPGGVQGTKLNDYGSFVREVIFERAAGPVRTNARLALRAHSPVEFVLTDPQGRRLGFDPRSSTTYDEIPDAYYGLDGGIAAADGSEFLPGSLTAWLNAPIDGDYILQVIGTGSGSYSIDGDAIDEAGAVTPLSGPAGTTTSGQVDSAVIPYASQVPIAVGGVAEAPDATALPAQTSTASAGNRTAYAVGGAAAAALALVAAGGWAMRRRRSE